MSYSDIPSKDYCCQLKIFHFRKQLQHFLGCGPHHVRIGFTVRAFILLTRGTITIVRGCIVKRVFIGSGQERIRM